SLLKEGFKLEGSTNKEDIYVKRIYDRENKIEAKERVIIDFVLPLFDFTCYERRHICFSGCGNIKGSRGG
ncbi:MAG: hypothetical protein J7L52_07845, partial [Thermotogae bacterium]|nr:hypothetical protein [Thermotogota bacterium]